MDPEDQYFVFENRLDSFQDPQPVAKGKASTAAASRAPKALLWPHKTLSPLALAKAGFFFQPHPKSPDNVVCFLCEKSLDGWEENDNPLEEHLKHSPTCGWAIMAAIEAGHGNYGKVHPLEPAMIEARKATFAGRWPYETKRGFKCKTKKLVEGGWKFTPSGEASDMTTCAYCNLALEGWESDDNPFDEHYRREPGCLFFALINQYPAPKKGRAKAGRASKASRLSVQSVATTVSDIGSLADVTADHDDSVMTTASTATQGGKKTAKGRKAATGKGRKPKAKKEEDVEILEDEPQEPSQPPAAKGRKRASDAMEDHAATDAEAPAPKKRGRGRPSATVEYPTLPDSEMADAIPTKPPAGKRKARASTSKPSRKVSQASVGSEASTASLRANIPDDDELDRQLEADLERYNSNEEDMAVEQAPAPAKGRPKKAGAARKTSSQRNAGSDSYAMFDPTPMVPDEAEIEADLEALQAEMGTEQSTETKPLVVPKRGRKPGTRKVSKQTKKAKEPSPEPAPAEEAPRQGSRQSPVQETEQPQQELKSEPELAEDPDVSTGTVVTKPEKRGRGRPSKKSTASQASVEEPEQRRSAGAMTQPEAQPEMTLPREPMPAQKNTPVKIVRKAVPPPSHRPASTPGPMATPPKATKSASIYPPSASRFQQLPSTPRRRVTPPPRTNQPASLRTRTPQVSDAENQPLSLQPAASVMPQRPVLAPLSVAQTPQRSSPSRRNIVSGLQSNQPWRPADLDLLFSSPLSKGGSDHGGADDKENTATVVRLLRKGAELTSPEKRMTVEEWIYHNAGLAEQKLKYECEAMVAAFEGEGGRALTVLEGLVVDAA